MLYEIGAFQALATLGDSGLSLSLLKYISYLELLNSSPVHLVPDATGPGGT